MDLLGLRLEVIVVRGSPPGLLLDLLGLALGVTIFRLIGIGPVQL